LAPPEASYLRKEGNAINIFLGFDPADSARANVIGTRLAASGHTVLTRDGSGLRSPQRELARDISESDVIVVIASQAGADDVIERGIELADGYGKQVIAVFGGVAATDDDVRRHAAHRIIDLQEDWTGSDEQWKRVGQQLEDILNDMPERSGENPLVSIENAATVDHAALFYDIEDERLGHEVLRARPGWRRVHHLSPISVQANRLPRVLLWTQASAEPHSLVRRQYEKSVNGALAFLVAAPDSPPPPNGTGLVVPVDSLLESRPRSRGLTDLNDAAAARAQVQFLLSQAHVKNHGCPLDVLNDRICVSSEVADLIREAYELAIYELHESELFRLTAVYRYALALRFYGDWRRAVEVIQVELRATQGELQEDNQVLRLLLELEMLVLQYELGDVRPDEIQSKVEEHQTEFRRLEDLIGYVQAGRVLGNLLRVRGDFDEAERVLQRTIGVAEYLAQRPSGDAPSRLLLADCHRELAGLYIARQDARLARRSLNDARGFLQSTAGDSNPAMQYLSAVLDLVDATLAQGDGVLMRATAPTEQTESALETLLLFENPIRIAQVYNWLGLAWARQIPQRHEDLVRGAEYLNKALRIRLAHQQLYTCGLSHLNLGELYEAMGQLDESIKHYQEARHIFNLRGVRPALARAHAALARAYARKSVSPGDEASHQSRQQLVEAEERYRQVGLDDEARELRYELQHGGRRPVDEVSDETPLIAVGEYLLHKWIREQAELLGTSLPENLQLRVGIGDDAAVVSASGARPNSSMVYTTDSAPGSLAILGRSPEYVGRFAVIQTLADILAMGARPVALLANVFLSRDATVGYVKSLIHAMFREADKYGVAVIGGDVKERNEQSVGCVGIGTIENSKVLRRSAAQPGQAVCITLASAPDGRSRLIGARWAQELVEHYQINSSGNVRNYPELAAVLDPRIKSDLLYVPDRVMYSAVSSGHLRAAMDTSDGVLGCLEILAQESEVGFELDEAAIDAIIDERARALANALDLPPAVFLFSAGHDWEIVFTCEEGQFNRVRDKVRDDLHGNGDVAQIGVVVPRADHGNGGIMLRRSNGNLAGLPYYTDEKFVPRSYQDRPSQWLTFATRLRPVTD